MLNDRFLTRRLRLSKSLADLVSGLAFGKGLSDSERLARIRLASYIGWRCHSGYHVFPELESAAASIGTTILPAAIEQHLIHGRTLHVLTKIYPIGGHTRFTRRWLHAERGESHAIVLTNQRETFSPDWVVPDGMDIPVISLSRDYSGDYYSRAAILSTMMQESRRVVLNIHPHDALAVAAAHRASGHDLFFINHADHVAWLGAALPARILNFRSAGRSLAVSRRGIPSGNHSILPIPMPPRLAGTTRAEARRQLGIADDTRLLLAMGSAYKFLAVGGQSLLDPLDQTLGRLDASVVFIGPDAHHPLVASLRARHPGKVVALGEIPSPSQWLSAADVYVESFPFSSTTAMLEAVSAGVNAVCYQPLSGDLGVLYSELTDVPIDLYVAQNVDAFVSLCEKAFGCGPEDEFRRHARVGFDQHVGEKWSQRLHQALKSSRLSPLVELPSADVPDLLDIMLAGLGDDPRYHPFTQMEPSLSVHEKAQIRTRQFVGRVVARLYR